MRDQFDEFNNVDYAEQEVENIRLNGFEDELAEVVQFYHAEQVRNVAEQLSRIADAMEESK